MLGLINKVSLLYLSLAYQKRLIILLCNLNAKGYVQIMLNWIPFVKNYIVEILVYRTIKCLYMVFKKWKWNIVDDVNMIWTVLERYFFKGNHQFFRSFYVSFLNELFLVGMNTQIWGKFFGINLKLCLMHTLPF